MRHFGGTSGFPLVGVYLTGRELKAAAEVELLKRLYEHLESGQPARTFVADKEEREAIRSCFLLTDKPVIYVANIAEGMDYSFSVNGVRSGYSGEYGSVTDSFYVPGAGELVIREVDYDADDRELEVEFNGRVSYGELKVEVTDESGASYEVRLREKDGDSVEVYVEGLNRGGEYTVTVSGVQHFTRK